MTPHELARLRAEYEERGIPRLLARWEQYHREYVAGETSRETVMSAYDDWTSAVDYLRQEDFDAAQGAEMLRSIGVKPSNVTRLRK